MQKLVPIQTPSGNIMLDRCLPAFEMGATAYRKGIRLTDDLSSLRLTDTGHMSFVAGYKHARDLFEH